MTRVPARWYRACRDFLSARDSMRLQNGLLGLRHQPAAALYVLALALFMTSVMARLFLVVYAPDKATDYPFALFYAVTMLVAVLLGQGPGLLVGGLSALFVLFFFMVPAGGTPLDIPLVDRFALGAFLFYVLMTTTLVGLLHATADRLAESERLRAMLLHEFRHRSRNDMASLHALLTLRSRAVGDEKARQHLLSAASHTLTLARVYRRLESYQGYGQDVVIDTHEFLTGLFNDMVKAQSDGLRAVDFFIDAESHPLPFERAIQLGLALNEAITNVLKYAFPGERPGRVTVRFFREADNFVLIVQDDGVGMADTAAPGGTGFGSRLFAALASQLGGAFTREPAEGGGTLVTLRFRAA